MNIETKLHVLGMNRFQMDGGAQFATVYVLEDDPERTADKLGSIALECKCDYDLIDRSREFQFPGDFTAKVQMVAGSKKKTTIYIHALTPLKGKPTTSAAKS